MNIPDKQPAYKTLLKEAGLLGQDHSLTIKRVPLDRGLTPGATDRLLAFDHNGKLLITYPQGGAQ